MVTLLRDHVAVTRQALFDALAAASHPARWMPPRVTHYRKTATAATGDRHRRWLFNMQPAVQQHAADKSAG